MTQICHERVMMHLLTIGTANMFCHKMKMNNDIVWFWETLTNVDRF